MANKCKDCGCTCKRCIASDQDVQLHVEIEKLKGYLLEKENHILTMETNFLNEANKFPNGELAAVQEELITWQDKYTRLYEAHRRVQRVNQGLEDKLLKLVDVCETEKTMLTKDVAILSHKLAEANYAIKKLTEDNERYKNDVSIAIQFLQCKQTSFVAKRYDSLPAEVQTQVSNFMTAKKKPDERKPQTEAKNIKVPIPTFPPTAMVYSVPKSPNVDRKCEPEVEPVAVDIVSAAIMAKVLEERQKEKANAKHCDSCTCASANLGVVFDSRCHSIGTQTAGKEEMGCARCEENVNAKRESIPILRNTEPKNHQKVLPIYPLDTSETISQVGHNIVKVQPNNFLLDKKSKSSSVCSSLIDLTQNSPKNAPTETTVSLEITNEVDLSSEKADFEVDDDVRSPKGPRYCSMRLQTGSKNILLDNAHENVSPVLYTRHHELKTDTSASDTYDSSTSVDKSFESSAHNRQRVVDWIEGSVEHKKKYAEMEENVKRFLFGESEFKKSGEKREKKKKSH